MKLHSYSVHKWHCQNQLYNINLKSQLSLKDIVDHTQVSFKVNIVAHNLRKLHNIKFVNDFVEADLQKSS